MGYSLRSWDYRYTLWLGFNPKTFQVGVSQIIPVICLSVVTQTLSLTIQYLEELYEVRLCNVRLC